MHIQKGGQEGSFRAPLLLRITLALVLCLMFFVRLPLFSSLVIREERTGRLLLVLPIAQEETFSIRYTHSVNLSPVTDTIRCSQGALLLESTLFSAYGWGMPVLADGIGGTFTNTENGFLISNIDKYQASIPILLQEVPDHHLLYRGAAISLLNIAGSGTLVRLTMENTSLLSRLCFIRPMRRSEAAHAGTSLHIGRTSYGFI